jgi:hypothetical protein
MEDLSHIPPDRLCLDLMLEALRVNDPRLNAPAAELFARSGAGLVPTLVARASSRRTSPPHRARLLGTG